MDRVDRRAWATRVAPAWLLWLLYAAATAVVVGIGQRWLGASPIESDPNEPPEVGLYRIMDLLSSDVSLVATLLLSFALAGEALHAQPGPSRRHPVRADAGVLGAALLAIGCTGAGGWLLLQLQEPRTEAQMRAYIGSQGMAQLAYGVLGIALTWGFWAVAHRGVPALPDRARGAPDIEAAPDVESAAGPPAQPRTAPPATAPIGVAPAAEGQAQPQRSGVPTFQGFEPTEPTARSAPSGEGTAGEPSYRPAPGESIFERPRSPLAAAPSNGGPSSDSLATGPAADGAAAADGGAAAADPHAAYRRPDR